MPDKSQRTNKNWTMRDGVMIRIRKMSDTHLYNTIRMLIRHAGSEQANALLFLPSFSGEMAQFYAEQEWDHINDISAAEFAWENLPVFKDLVSEADYRGIEIEELDDIERDPIE